MLFDGMMDGANTLPGLAAGANNNPRPVENVSTSQSTLDKIKKLGTGSMLNLVIARCGEHPSGNSA